MMMTEVPLMKPDVEGTDFVGVDSPSSPSSSSSSSPPLSLSLSPPTAELLIDQQISEAVLANLESFQESLAETPLLGTIEDEPSTIGSHGLPLLDLVPSTPLSVSPGSPPPPIGGNPLLPTPPISPIGVRVMESDEESPCGDITTPLKFDCNEATWRPSEEVVEPRLTPPRVIPTIDYLQVPPHHRAKLRKKRKVSFGKADSKRTISPPPCTPVVMPALSEDEAVVVTELPVEEASSEDDLDQDPIQPNGGLLTVVPPPAGSDKPSNLSAANCVIKIPQKSRKPSFSKIDIPCYHRRPSGHALDVNFDYTFTVMYGRYTKDLGRYAREEAKKLKKEEKTGSGASGLRPYRGKVATKCLRILGTIWQATFARVGEDWVFLAVLGIVMAIISFIMDYGIAMCNKARIWLYRDLASHTALQYLAWVSLPVCLILFSAGFVHILAPQAVGSGIPEMKTILRGVVLKEYLTFKTLIAKVIGLTATLGSGLPLGKEGPFVHIASIVATLLSKAVTSFKGIYENESRNSEMLAAACAVGVACSFAAPIGGVLFSIEVTSVYFAVRNYWRGFFAAVCGAMMFRLLAVWFNDEDTLTPLFETSYKVDIPFDPQEIVVFSLIGVMSGFLGALFVWVHRQYVIFMRKNKKMKAFLQKSRLLYPLVIMLLLTSLTFPPGFGQFMAGGMTNHHQSPIFRIKKDPLFSKVSRFAYPVLTTLILLTIQFPGALGQFIAAHLSTHHQVVDLFSNVTWTKEELSVQEFEIVENWRTPWTGVFVNLIVYITFTFCATVVASTLPVPSGIFIPVFKMGAALGRFMGEAMACTFPNGLRYGGHNHIIIPGGYSIVGAAALAGAVTHTISTSVIVFELTGQITHILPVMIAVLIANAIAQLLQPSVYDSIIQIKKLPYLPDILTATSGAYNIYVEDFMVRDVKYIWYGITYRQLKNILKEHKKIRSLPLVDSPDSMILLGSIQRSELISMLEEHLGKDRRLRVINKWKLAAQKALEAEQMEQEAEEAKREEERKKRLMDIEEGKKPVPSAGLAMVAGIGGALAAATGIGFNFRGDQSPDSSPPSTTATPESTPILTSTPTTSSAATAVNPVISLTTSEITEDTEIKQRRPSRFEVVKVDSPARHESTVTLQIDPVEIPTASESALHRPSEAALRSPLPKSILKKTNSFILHPAPSSPFVSPQHTPYATVHAGDSRLRQAFEAVLRKTSLLKMDDKGIHSSQNLATPTSASKRVSLPADRMIEMTLEEQRRWEEEELNKEVDFSKCHIDPAPFQLVERTSLLKVHSLFSMLGLNHAYVTAIGRIIGVVALKELRKAIEETNSGDFPKPEAAPPPTVPPEEASEPLNSATVNNEEKD